jgi:hypothetical protein
MVWLRAPRPAPVLGAAEEGAHFGKYAVDVARRAPIGKRCRPAVPILLTLLNLRKARSHCELQPAEIAPNFNGYSRKIRSNERLKTECPLEFSGACDVA